MRSSFGARHVDFLSHPQLQHVHDHIDTQTIRTQGARDWESFKIGADNYIAVANNYDGVSRNIDSKVSAMLWLPWRHTG